MPLDDVSDMDTLADFARTDTEHLDVLIVGAGLSGIGAAWHLQDKCPGKSYAILEAREASGGTWDLFRYPGIRSDSDMYTLGYSFRPWKDAKAIADGPSILTYIREVASDHGIDRQDPLRPSRGGGLLVDAGRALDGRDRAAGREQAQGARSPAASCGCAAATTTTQAGYTAGVPGHRALQGPHRPSAEMDRRHRLRRQAGRGDRQRRHGGHPGAGDGRDRRARHHAAALADLRRGAAGRGSRSPTACAAACRSSSPTA